MHRCVTRGHEQRRRRAARRELARCRSSHRSSAIHHSGTKAKTPTAPGSTTAAGTTSTNGSATAAPLTTTSTGGETTAPTSPTAPPSVPHVQVTAVEYSFTLSRATVPAGKVVFEFVNNGQDEHNLNIESGEGQIASSFPDAPSKGVRDQTVEMRPGTYTLFCSLPEHEKKGMKATLVVE